MGSGFDWQPNPLRKDESCRAGLKKSDFFGEVGLLIQLLLAVHRQHHHLILQPDEAFGARGLGQGMLPQRSAVSLAPVQIMVARQQQLGAIQPRKQLQRSPKKAQRMAHVASHHQAIGLLRRYPAGKGQELLALRGAIMQIGGDEDAHGNEGLGSEELGVTVQGSAVFQSSDWPELGGAPTPLQATGQAKLASQLSAPTVALSLWTVGP